MRILWGFVAIVTFAGVAGVGRYAYLALRTEDLPTPNVSKTCCLFPGFDLRDTKIGQTEDWLRRRYGLAAIPARSGANCVHFVYDEEEPPFVLSVLVENGRIRSKWLGPPERVPEACRGVVSEHINVAEVLCYHGG